MVEPTLTCCGDGCCTLPERQPPEVGQSRFWLNLGGARGYGIQGCASQIGCIWPLTCHKHID